jgi:predicted acyltransferase
MGIAFWNYITGSVTLQTMRKRTLAAASLLLAFSLVMGFVSAPVASAAKNHFVGAWSAKDVQFDNSQEWLLIGWNQNSGYRVVYYDEAAGGTCGYDSHGHAYGTVIIATGTSKGNVLTSAGPAWCMDPQHTLWSSSYQMVFTYHQSTHTLTGVYSTWTRL